MTEPSAWYVYVLRCADRSFYTGITTDLARRVAEHNGVDDVTRRNAKLNPGARYTRSRRPVEVVYSENSPSRSAAAKREYAIKRLSVAQKRELVTSAGVSRSGD